MEETLLQNQYIEIPFSHFWEKGFSVFENKLSKNQIEFISNNLVLLNKSIEILEENKKLLNTHQEELLKKLLLSRNITAIKEEEFLINALQHTMPQYMYDYILKNKKILETLHAINDKNSGTSGENLVLKNHPSLFYASRKLLLDNKNMKPNIVRKDMGDILNLPISPMVVDLIDLYSPHVDYLSAKPIEEMFEIERFRNEGLKLIHKNETEINLHPWKNAEKKLEALARNNVKITTEGLSAIVNFQCYYPAKLLDSLQKIKVGYYLESSILKLRNEKIYAFSKNAVKVGLEYIEEFYKLHHKSYDNTYAIKKGIAQINTHQEQSSQSGLRLFMCLAFYQNHPFPTTQLKKKNAAELFFKKESGDLFDFTNYDLRNVFKLVLLNSADEALIKNVNNVLELYLSQIKMQDGYDFLIKKMFFINNNNHVHYVQWLNSVMGESPLVSKTVDGLFDLFKKSNFQNVFAAVFNEKLKEEKRQETPVSTYLLTKFEKEVILSKTFKIPSKKLKIL